MFIDCNCLKVKLWLDGKFVVDVICDKVGECMCLIIVDVGEVILIERGCVVGGMLFLILEVYVSFKLDVLIMEYYFVIDS